MVAKLSEWFGDALHNIILVLPRLLGFIVILVVGFIIARVVYSVVKGILERIKLGNLVGKLGPSGKNPLPSDWSPAEILAKVCWFIIALVTGLLAFDVFGANNPVSELLRKTLEWTPKGLVAVVILAIGFAIAKGLRDILKGAFGRQEYGSIVAMAGYWFVGGLAILAALSQAGIALVLTSTLTIFVFGTVAGILIVGAGGGLIKPMQARWESILSRGAQAVSENTEE